ncbi:hypothetical protein JCM33374_g2797 [Metschnikowia sp. JCM 33374]|nr:hypothetical protein JCM33374_g2797 [Metschnikowia sp. JCM 33374]
MANFGFVKCSRRERLKFFQSSLPYLNNNALISNSTGKTRKWFSEEPHSTNKGFLTFKNGHYGIYFTLFNHELRKKDHDTTSYDTKNIIFIVREVPTLDFLPEFFISKANQDIHNDVKWLKTITRNLLSTTSLVKSQCSFQKVYQTRKFSTSAFNKRDIPTAHHSHQKFENITKIPHEDPAQYAADGPISSEQVADEEMPFEESFLKSQLGQIVHTFENHESPEDLNIIYPIYQSLKRNNIILPSIKEYNIVLKSISMRSLDSEASLTETESRLTCLLTVYQDILAACQENANCHPNSETYHTVLHSIFRSSRALLSISISDEVPSHTYQYCMSKASEFCQVGVDLFASLFYGTKISNHDILPDLFYCLDSFPNLINNRLASVLAKLKDHNSNDPQFYIGLISLGGYLCTPEASGHNKKEAYDFVSSVFDNYKLQCQKSPHLADAEYEVYSAMLKALISSNNHPIATKFLDEIIISYKDGLSIPKPAQISTQTISRLISSYMESFMSLGNSQHLDRAYNLLKKMREVVYLPDVKASVYNDMICRYITEYVKWEQVKADPKKSKEVNREQEIIYKKIWDLYNHVAIRKDFVQFTPHSKLKVNCTEMLLSLSIDLGDMPNVSRLIKELLLRNTLIGDWNVSKKLCHVLSKEAFHNGSYHHEVMWCFLEQQATHFKNDPAQLNDFLSEHIAYILIDTPRKFSQIMNSILVRDAFQNFDLQTNSILGVRSLLSYLVSELEGRTLPSLEKAKILAYQASLINEFEDTENHYLELSSELMVFQENLKSSFRSIFLAEHGNKYLNEAVYQACANLGLIPGNYEGKHLCLTHYKQDLIPYFNVSSKHGIKLFIQRFKEGYNFSDETWGAVINRSFAMDILEPGKTIAVPDFLQRLMFTGNESSLISHIISLISLHNDKVNIELFKFLVAHKRHQILQARGVLNTLATFAKHTQNHYFLTLFVQEFMELAKLNSSKTWMVKILEKLNAMGRHSEIYALVSKNLDYFHLDIRSTTNQEFLRNIVVAYIKTGKDKEINEIFNHYFSGSEEKKLLLSSNELLACLLEYYISVGSHDMVVQKFGKFAERSTGIKQSIQFTNFLLTLQGSHSLSECTHDANAYSFALSLLKENDLLKMKELYEANCHLVDDKEIFFNAMITGLTKAAKILDGENIGKLSAKFEAVIKFCKVMRLRKISAETLSNVMDFLTLSGSKNVLNILFNKFLINNNLVPSFNFYFLEVELKSEAELSNLLEHFEAGFRKTGDLLNLKMIDNFKGHDW